MSDKANVKKKRGREAGSGRYPASLPMVKVTKNMRRQIQQIATRRRDDMSVVIRAALQMLINWDDGDGGNATLQEYAEYNEPPQDDD